MECGRKYKLNTNNGNKNASKLTNMREVRLSLEDWDVPNCEKWRGNSTNQTRNENGKKYNLGRKFREQ